MLKKESSILILTIDCNHKSIGGNPEYFKDESIFSSNIADSLISEIGIKRQEIFNLLKEEKIRWDKDRNELRINKGLKKGHDFNFQQIDIDAKYLPAILRYKGGFYSGLEESGKQSIKNCNHHFLILSACYGLLLPFEPIQYYACQFGDKNEAYKLWTQADFISKVLIDYILKNQISRIFDFTYCSVEAFQDCFNWNYIQEKTGVEILHAYHRWNEGDDALFNFGSFFRDFIDTKSQSELLDIDSDVYYDDIIFKTEKRLDSISCSLDTFEINIRKFIHNVLDSKYQNFWEEFDKRDSSIIPLSKKINENITKEIMKNPFLKQFQQDKLDYCDIFDYQKIINKFWTDFEPIFLSKRTMEKHFENIVELRNPKRHVRDSNDVIIEMGKASIKWFDYLFKNQGI
jgi:cytoplasmic iron level regulating protein YaaA (DUF328/UPF0246 family)